MDFAIVQIGGKQFKITPQSVINVEKLEAKPGDKMVFDKVLMVVDGDDIKIGTPYLENVSFEAVVEGDLKGAKVRVLRYHQKSRWRRSKGFRQSLTELNFTGKAKASKKEVKAETKEVAETKVKAEKKEASSKKTAATEKTAKTPAKKKSVAKKEE